MSPRPADARRPDHRGGAPRPGALFALPLTDRPGDGLTLRVLADLERDIAPSAPAHGPWPLDAIGAGVLVEARAGTRVVLPGAWLAPGELGRARAMGIGDLDPRDVRLPAVVLGDGAGSVLAWGETVWPLPFEDAAAPAIPAACRPRAHSLAELRRLALVALGRRADVGLTLWQDEAFEVPWADVRLVPRARWWFSLAQVPPEMTYADAARAQGLPLERWAVPGN